MILIEDLIGPHESYKIFGITEVDDFLHDAPLLLLDEPTSNLDVLNEGQILKSLQEAKDKTMVIVSHRNSSLSIADKIENISSANS